MIRLLNTKWRAWSHAPSVHKRIVTWPRAWARTYTLWRGYVTWCYIRHFTRDMYKRNGIGGKVQLSVTSGVSCETSWNKYVAPHLYREQHPRSYSPWVNSGVRPKPILTSLLSRDGLSPYQGKPKRVFDAGFSTVDSCHANQPRSQPDLALLLIIIIINHYDYD